MVFLTLVTSFSGPFDIGSDVSITPSSFPVYWYSLLSDEAKQGTTGEPVLIQVKVTDANNQQVTLPFISITTGPGWSQFSFYELCGPG